MDEFILKLFDVADRLRRLVYYIVRYVPLQERCELRTCRKQATIKVCAYDLTNLDRRQMHIYNICNNQTHCEEIERQNSWVVTTRHKNIMTKSELALRSVKVLSDKDPNPLMRLRLRLKKRCVERRLRQMEHRRAIHNRPCGKCGLPLSGFYPSVCLCDDQPMTF